MKKITFRVLGLVLMMSVLAPFSAHASWSIMGGMHQYGLTGATDEFKPEFGLGYHFGPLEADVLYTTRNFGSNSSIQVPVFYRFPAMSPLQVGIGGFADYALKEVIGLPTVDFGLAASVQFQLPISMTMSLMVDGRYLYGLADLSGAHSSDLGFLVGLVFR